MRALPGAEKRTPSGSRPAVPASAADHQRRARIIRATTELIAKRGYQGTRVELIIDRAHVGYSSLYRLFPDKVDIFTAIFDEASGRAFAAIEAAYEEAPGKWPEKIAAALRTFFAGIYADPLLAKTCLVESLTAGPPLAARYEAAVLRAAEFLRGGRAYAPRSAEMPESYEEVIVGGVLWIPYQSLLIGEVEGLPDLYPEALEFILRHYLGERRAAQIASAAEWLPPSAKAVAAAPSS
jgi:AcrR family transcriptional regulator